MTCGLIAGTFYKSAVAFVLLIAVDLILYPPVLREKLRKDRLWKLNLEFKEAIGVLSGALSSGYSVENAFYEVYSELCRTYGKQAMISKEMKLICDGIRLNKPVETMLESMAARSGLQDVRNFAEVFVIAKRSGGDMCAIIDRTVYIIREKAAVAEDIRNVTASKQYEQRIMNILPFAIIFYIGISSPGFLDVMYAGAAGRAVMTVCLLLLVAAYVLQKKILEIEV